MTSPSWNSNASSSANLNIPANHDFILTDLEGKTPVQQLDELKEILVIQNRIKEGAQNLLNMQEVSDALRGQLESELDMAQGKIEYLRWRIEMRARLLFYPVKILTEFEQVTEKAKTDVSSAA
ncbi:hypothetical protein MVEN_00386900 [Mycena venus]|uniref:Uncharacterized protein n=1 Tax=Mycena venus TaxID=2733690 RepID=A0A8H7D7I7_9AGAR|nr:hypothetical protein MVEN_00386900 [Mycena venus]